MTFFSKKIKKEFRELCVDSSIHKVNIIYENRKNSRVSITKTGINIRIASFLSKKEKENQIANFLTWAEKTIRTKNISFAKNQRSFKTNDVLKLFDKDVTIKITEIDKLRVSGSINQDTININLPKSLSQEAKEKYLSKIISRLLALNYKEKISKKLHDFNRIYQFGSINNVRLKNNSTNWGSCSSKNNINISIRLFLAPEWVVDYVLIHELSHLKERNHSANFWDVVEKAYPNYREAEKWLKKNSSKCIV